MAETEHGHLAGVMVVDDAGQVVSAAGVAQDPRLKAMAGDARWLASALARRLQPVVIDRKGFLIAAVPLGAGAVILVSHPPGSRFLDFVTSVDFAYELLEHMISDPFEAMTVIDAAARIAFISPVHERFFGLERGEAIGKPVRDVIENTKLDRVLRTGKAEIGELQRMRGAERVVNRIPIKRDGHVIGAIGRVTFKGPAEVEALNRRINALESEVAFYRREATLLRNRRYGLDSLVGDSAAMRRVRAEIIKIAPLEIPVLIHGESGTGKELVAHALHALSPRRDANMVTINAAALPSTLVEAELFGYAPGAFTGADKKGRTGKFEQAANGTIFLDEIGDMPVDVQVKLLRVLQDRVVERIGGERPVEVDFRFISATNRDLQDMIAKKEFRLDLYYRISPIIIRMPALRERIGDIPTLVDAFLRELSQRHALPAPGITADALSWLSDQPWPGNVRQLRHEIERAFVFADDGLITVETLVERHAPAAEEPVRVPRRTGDASLNLRDARDHTETEMIRAAMRRLGGNKKRVAAELGISRTYLYKKLDEMAVKTTDG